MSTKLTINGEMRRLQQAAALLACMQQTALYGNDPEADLADCMLVVLKLIREAVRHLDQIASTREPS